MPPVVSLLRPVGLGDGPAGHLDADRDRAVLLAQVVRAGLHLGEHRGELRPVRRGPLDDGHVLVVVRPVSVVLVVRELAAVMVRVGVTVRLADLVDLDLGAVHSGREPEHNCADVLANVEEYRALTGERVLGQVGRPLVGQGQGAMLSGHRRLAQAAGVPGSDWYPPAGVPR